jgi:hypothetical protein
LIRAIDVMSGNMIVGLRSGQIIETNLGSGTASNKVLVNSHNSGEVWGLAQAGDKICTTGDDNQIISWDPASRKLVSKADVNSQKRKAK